MKSSSNTILRLYKQKQSVFSVKEASLIWQESNSANIKSYLKYFADKGDLIRLRRGIYAKTGFDVYEVATKIYTPSYVSFETVLRNEGVIFQHYETIFVASYLTRSIELDNKQKISYRKIKNSILFNSEGIIKKKNYAIASKERAFLDMLYLMRDYYFDNLKSIDWKKCFELVKIYESKEMERRLTNYYNKYK
ncbi:MAG: hypothetical protein COX30_00680 [Candidatus Moranbacteria bacterium CG23_combo_of_CG06-09_8_20_14_all_39_10]|nr:MAG: hypothetical protein COX30_00680 [Candidatus Moranbacteria bacterium CG23_combo_of_CG06-09_8_20_14_all_39_10]